jgi:hypothetical protein
MVTTQDLEDSLDRMAKLITDQLGENPVPGEETARSGASGDGLLPGEALGPQR